MIFAWLQIKIDKWGDIKVTLTLQHSIFKIVALILMTFLYYKAAL